MTHLSKPPSLFARVKKGVRHAEAGALVSVFERSATELKLKQIATFNVRTLNRIDQLPELTASAIDHNIDTFFMQEHRYTHSEDIKHHDSGNTLTLAPASARKNSVNATKRGVGILIGPRALKSQNTSRKYN